MNESSTASLYEQGQAAAAHLWRHWRKRPKIDDPRDAEFARGALAAIVARLSDSDDVDKEMREYSETAAEQLTTASRTIYELLQNADDLRADSIRFSLRRGGRGSMLVVHNGDPVVLPDVIAMTLAFLSWKRDDAAAKGRFGIGLKTLNQVGARLSVHCEPYHFAVEKGGIEPIDPVRHIRHLFDAAAGETLLILDLDQEFEVEEVEGWIRAIDASHLLFLDHVRSLSLVNLRSGRSVWTAGLREEQLSPVEIELRPGSRPKAHRSRLSDTNQPARTWNRYGVEYQVPTDLKRAHKATGTLTPLAIAISELSEAGNLAAGMPLDFPASFPISLNAQFDPDLGRRGLTERKWNRWLFGRLAELAAAVAQFRFENDIANAWKAVPLNEEMFEGDRWIVDSIRALIKAVHDRIRVKARIGIGDRIVRLSEVSYETAEIEGLLTKEDYRILAPNHEPLPTSVRDNAGRWRRVLDAIGSSRRIETDQLLELLGLDNEELGPRPREWFIGVADAAIAVDLEDRLSELPSVVTDDGSRYSPRGQMLLVRQSDERSIASRLELEKRVAPEYFSTGTPVRVREWLNEHLSSSAADPVSVLSALSRRSGDLPLSVDDKTLVMLRDALNAIDDVHRPSLAAAVGNVIAVDGYVFQNEKKVSRLVKPAAAYLPTPIAKDTHGWAAAAKTTEGIQWIDPRYAASLRGGPTGDLSARRFFLLLGAGVGPRIVPSGDGARVQLQLELPIAQADALAQMVSPQMPSHIMRDWISPDLERVIADIVRRPVDGKRRERSRALFETLAREWDRLADRSETRAVYFYYSWRTAGALPATWLAQAASEPWLSSKSRRKVAPREVAIENATTRLTRGQQRSQYVFELDEHDSAHPLVDALGIKGTPPASELLDELKALKERHGTQARLEDVQPLYAALAALARRDGNQGAGDVSAAELRRAFDNRTLLLTGGKWTAPSNAFRGRPIFGKRRPFVPDHKLLVPLWQLLGIAHPETSDCLNVLEEIADSGAAPSYEDQAIMVDVFRHLAEQEAPRTPGIKRRLAHLPLWTSTGWQKERPLYAVHDRSLEMALGDQIALWSPGCSIQSLRQIPVLLGVNVLTDREFALSSKNLEASVGATAMMFQRAVAYLRNEFAKKSQRLWSAMNWEGLTGLKLVLADPLLTQADVGGRKVSVRRRTHIEAGHLYYEDSEELGSPDTGARVVSAFFVGEPPEMLDYAWSYAWRAVEEGYAPETELGLATESDETDPFDELILGGRRATGKRLFAGGAVRHERRIGKTKVPPPPPPRHLKTFEDATISRVEILDGTQRSEPLKKASKTLIIEPVKSAVPGDRRLRSPDPVKEWSDEERERRGFELLAGALKEINQQELMDFRAVRHIGADSIDELRRYFELKAYLGDMPDEVRFEPSQFERAVREGKNYFLAVVSGLEEGRETQISIFPDPVRNLQWRRTSTIKLGGIRSGGSRVLRISIETGQMGGQ